jgi:hypothetical protein
MSARDDLLRWANDHIRIGPPQRKLDFLIVGLPWHEAELLSVTLAGLPADIHVDVIAASPPPSSINFPSLRFGTTDRIQVDATWGPQFHCRRIGENRSPISSRPRPRIGPSSTVVFDGFGAYATALNGKLRPFERLYAGVILRTSAAIRETSRRVAMPHLPHYFFGHALEAAIPPTRQRLAPVFEKLGLWFQFMARIDISTAVLLNRSVVVFGSGRLAKLTAEWFRGQAAIVSELPVKPVSAEGYSCNLYKNAVKNASIVVVAEIGAESHFLSESTYLELFRHPKILINMASTPFEFGVHLFSSIVGIERGAMPFVGSMIDIPRGDDTFRLYMLGDGHPLLDSLISTTPPEAVVKAQLMAASELLNGEIVSSNCQPSKTVRDLLAGI